MPLDLGLPLGTPGHTAGEKTPHDIEQLIRLLRDSDSATRTLAAWSGHPIHLDLVSRHDDHLTAAEFADFDVRQPEPVQRRTVRLMDLHDRALSEASATVLLGRMPTRTVAALREGDVPLGLLLAPMYPRRHTLSVVRRETDTAEEAGVLFEVRARLDVGGRPIALVHERYLRTALL